MSRRALLWPVGLVLATLACRAPNTENLIPLELYQHERLADLYARWQVPLIVVRGVVYAPPVSCLQQADESTLARVQRLAAERPALESELVLPLPSHPVAGLHQFAFRGAGYRRARVYDGERLLEERDGFVYYEPATRP